MIIRDATLADVPELLTLLLGGTLAPEGESPDNVALYEEALREIWEEGNTILVADDNGEVVGMSQFFTFRHFQQSGGRACEVESVHVRADRRSQGIGSLLLAEIDRRARAAGCYRVQLTSRNEREDAHRFYRREGYSQNSQGFKKFL
jgi:GNAT superfamily N-acetyltransferase